MPDKEIEQKIEELIMIAKTLPYGLTFPSEQFKVIFDQAILFGQSHMKQRVIQCIPEEEEFTNGMNYEQANYLNGHNEFRDQVLEAVEKL